MIKDLKSLKDVWHKLMYVLDSNQKKIGILVFIMSIIGALLETLGVSVIVPFVEAMVSPSELLDNMYIGLLFRTLHLSSESNIILIMCILVVIVYLLKNLYLILLSWVRSKYSCKILRELSTRVMRSYMKREYTFFIKTNIGALIRGTAHDANGIYAIIYQGFRIISEGLTAFFICIYILTADFWLALCVIGVGLLCLALITITFRKPLKHVAEINFKYESLVSKYMMEAYSGIKEIMVTHRQKYFVSKYEDAYSKQQNATVVNTVAQESPAYIIEALCISGIIIAVAFRVVGMEDPSTFIPKLSAFAVAAFKILPSLGRISNAFNAVIFHLPYLNDAYSDFKEVENANQFIKNDGQMVLNEQGEIHLNDSIVIDNISWRYPDAKAPVFENLNLVIKKGNSIGIIGESGAGKSTLMDTILGLYKPQEGHISVDGKDISTIPMTWAKMIGYVPQSVFLTNDTIRNNVTFGIFENYISDDQVWKTLEDAQIADFVRTLPDGLDTVVGDRGIRFSGGQRQRIAIARALYYDPDILIFDEATSALDNDTEAALMESIESFHGKKTLIIVAHRLTTIRNCDEIYRIENGNCNSVEKEQLDF